MRTDVDALQSAFYICHRKVVSCLILVYITQEEHSYMSESCPSKPLYLKGMIALLHRRSIGLGVPVVQCDGTSVERRRTCCSKKGRTKGGARGNTRNNESGIEEL
jgi:hypothetical protein